MGGADCFEGHLYRGFRLPGKHPRSPPCRLAGCPAPRYWNGKREVTVNARRKGRLSAATAFYITAEVRDRAEARQPRVSDRRSA